MYAVRIENPKERDQHANDLIRILQEKEHEAIGELAQNPLLLTIFALVHRIDAVLPDERVVLYQKCTETLLNTWHTWKFREMEIKHREQVEQVFWKGNIRETEIYFAAWLLIFDVWLYIYDYHNSPEESNFKGLAQITVNIDKPPLRIAHCIRDLAYGDESRADDLEAR